LAASVVARETVALAPDLGLEPRPAWEAISRGMHVPVDRRTKVIRNHDRYRPGEEKGATPEALAGIFPFTYDATPEVEQASYAFYLDLAAGYVGSPMLSALLPTYAARLGRREEARELLEKGYAAFVVQPFSITAEYDPRVFPEQEVAGPFTANIGAFLTTCLYGFTGIRLGAGNPRQWAGRPVVLPRGWDGIEVERLRVRGRAATLSARHGAHAVLEIDD